jgi:uncharacterized protein HemY
LRKAVEARDDGRYATAVVDADRAHRWMPWSTRPSVVAAEAALFAGDRAGSRRYLSRALAKDEGDWESWLVLSRATSGRVSRAALTRASRLNRVDASIAALKQQVETSEKPK